MEQKNLQRLTVHLKGGQTMIMDFSVEEADKLNPQIELLANNLGDLNVQNKVVVFNGQKRIGIRISEVAAYEVLPLVLTAKAEEEKAEEAAKQ